MKLRISRSLCCRFLVGAGALVGLLFTASLSRAQGNPFTPVEETIEQQHDITRQGIDSAEYAIVGDIEGAQQVLNALTAIPPADPPCGAGTEEQRFVIHGEWVCDNTTALKWQKVPNKILNNGYDCLLPSGRKRGCSWHEAIIYCASLGPGFRLPDPFELVGLVDYNQPSVEIASPDYVLHPFPIPGPVYALDPNGPFDDTTNNTNPFDFKVDFGPGFDLSDGPAFWTVNEVAWSPNSAIYVRYNNGFVDAAQKNGLGGVGLAAWCVHDHEEAYHAH